MPALAHIGIGLLAKKFAPKASLWLLIVGAMMLDIIWVLFFYLPFKWISHGLFMAIIWSILSFFICLIITKIMNSKKAKSSTSSPSVMRHPIIQTSIFFGLLVFSHWVLDFIGWPMSVIDPNATGTPLLFNDSQTIGLGVYGSWVGALSMDLGIFLVGLGIYFKTRKELRKEKKK
jgi:hypothetical protein